MTIESQEIPGRALTENHPQPRMQAPLSTSRPGMLQSHQLMHEHHLNVRSSHPLRGNILVDDSILQYQVEV